jgi:DNA adenine methylase
MGFTLSPLRYPGGKSRLSGFVREVLRKNGLEGGAYAEAFAGGAGIAWSLLLDGSVTSVHLNDYDPAIYAFWRAVRDQTEDLCRLITDTQVRMSMWNRQRVVILEPSEYSQLELGFATFFLNRTNRSGVVRGGVIGGKRQAGKWKLGCRYNRKGLIRRIQNIASHRASIYLYHMEARRFIQNVLPGLDRRTLVFLDPPYYGRGQDLYMDLYSKADHRELAKDIIQTISQPWIVSYDDEPSISRYYAGMKRQKYGLSYSVAARYVGSELLFFSQKLTVPVDAIPRYPVKQPKAVRPRLSR